MFDGDFIGWDEDDPAPAFGGAAAAAAPASAPDYKSICIAPKQSDLELDLGGIARAQAELLSSLRKTKLTYSSSQECIDIQFRLLHQDFMKEFLEGISDYRFGGGRRGANPKIKLYQNLTCIKTGRKATGEIRDGKTLKFNLPIQENGLRGIDWDKSKSLINGSLVGITPDNFKSIKFGTVQYFGPPEYRVECLSKGLLHIQLFPDYGDAVEVIMEFDGDGTKFLLIESLTFFECYQHPLAALKRLDLDACRLKKYLVDGEVHFGPLGYGDGDYSNGVDLYEPIDLSIFMKDKKEGESGIFNFFESDTWPPADALGFNESQYSSFKRALTAEMAIIQGPPGTGKSFTGFSLIKALITNPILLRSHGPVLIISQTNHTLDQLLQQILTFAKEYFKSDSKAENLLLRLGGGSTIDDISKKITLREKSFKQTEQQITKRNLKIYKDGYTAALSIVEKMSGEHLFPDEKELDKILAIGKEIIKVYDFLGAIKTANRDLEWRSKRVYDKFRTKLSSCFASFWKLNERKDSKTGKKLSEDVIIKDPQLSERKYSAAEIASCLKLKNTITEVLPILKNQNIAITQKWEQLKDFDADEVLIIGATATGASKYKEAELKKLQPQIILVEEAGHLLEADVIASLTKFTRQLILIGDHQQLRPSTSDYQLTREFGGDMSLMERLVKHAESQCFQNWVQLNIQHRMRPEIAKLITPSIYPVLFNAPSVENYKNVCGLEKNLYFFHHEFPEKTEHGGTSFSNPQEADFIHGLCIYLLSQGYLDKQISVITTYLGQKKFIGTKFKMADGTKKVRISCVDGFQGEENDIILLSLVRNNGSHNIGFMETDNRVCVALSRAKIGFYIAGNMDSLALKSKTWALVNETLKSQDSIGTELKMYCHLHKQTMPQGEGQRGIGPGIPFPIQNKQTLQWGPFLNELDCTWLCWGKQETLLD